MITIDRVTRDGEEIASAITVRDCVDAIKSGAKQHVRIHYVYKNVLFDENDVSSEGINISTNLVNDDIVSFGSTVSTEVTFSLLKSSRTETNNLKSEFKLEFGIEVEEDIAWFSFGYFRTQDISFDKLAKTYYIVAYDRMQRFNIDVKEFIADVLDKDDSAGSTWTANQILEMLCNYVGVKYNTEIAIQSRCNGSIYKADSYDLITGSCNTCRDLLGKIAEAAFGYAFINKDGTLDIMVNAFFHNGNNNYVVIDESNCFSLEEKKLLTNYVDVTWLDIAMSTVGDPPHLAMTTKWKDLQGLKWEEFYNHTPLSDTRYEIVFVTNSNGKSYQYTEEGYARKYTYVIRDNPFFEAYLETDWLIASLEVIIREKLFQRLLYDYILEYAVSMDTTGEFFMAEVGDRILKTSDNSNSYTIPIYNVYLNWNGTFNCSFSTAKLLM